jgi:hypothetical protein
MAQQALTLLIGVRIPASQPLFPIAYVFQFVSFEQFVHRLCTNS